jgi:anti-sigma-K factor RskA
MNRDHSLIDELLAVQALGGLDGGDVALLERELVAHGDCMECRRLEAAHREVAGMLPAVLDPRPIDDSIVDRIVATPRMGARWDTAPSGDELAGRRDARLARWRAAFGVAAAVAVVLAVTLAVRSSGDVLPVRAFIRFEGGEGELAMGYSPGDRGIVLWGTGLPDPGAGKVYELWMIEDGTPVRGACLTPTEGSLAAFVDADVGSTDLMAVTVEDRACPDAPTTDPVYTAAIA